VGQRGLSLLTWKRNSANFAITEFLEVHIQPDLSHLGLRPFLFAANIPS
jgi:hypothetical protein